MHAAETPLPSGFEGAETTVDVRTPFYCPPGHGNHCEKLEEVSHLVDQKDRLSLMALVLHAIVKMARASELAIMADSYHIIIRFLSWALSDEYLNFGVRAKPGCMI